MTRQTSFMTFQYFSNIVLRRVLGLQMTRFKNWATRKLYNFSTSEEGNSNNAWIGQNLRSDCIAKLDKTGIVRQTMNSRNYIRRYKTFLKTYLYKILIFNKLPTYNTDRIYFISMLKLIQVTAIIFITSHIVRPVIGITIFEHHAIVNDMP